MASKFNAELLTAEERKKVGFDSEAHYAVRFTNKSGEVLYVTMRESLTEVCDDDYSRRVKFKLYDGDLHCLEETFTNHFERGSGILSLSKALEKAAATVGEEGKRLYIRAAQMAADMERKREELGQRLAVAAQKEKREKNVAFKAVKRFFGGRLDF